MSNHISLFTGFSLPNRPRMCRCRVACLCYFGNDGTPIALQLMPGSPHVTIAEEMGNVESPTSVSRGNRPGQRKVWLHLASSSASTSSTDLSASPSPGIALLRKRPDPLTSIEFLGYKSHATATSSSSSASSSTSSSSSSSAASRFPFISPVEPLTTLARFHRSLNKVYIPLDEEEELEIVRTAASWVGLIGWEYDMCRRLDGDSGCA